MQDSLAPDVAALLGLLASGPQLSFAGMAVGDAREAVRQMGAAFDAPADPSVAVEEAALTHDGRAIRLRCYTPPHAEADRPAILFIHGGGWVVGGLDEYDSFCRYLSRIAGLRVASLDYRLAPETPFPGAWEDARVAAAWLIAGNSPFGAVDGLILAGDSAGGGIAAALAGRAGDLALDVRATLLFYPVLDVSQQAQSYADFAEGFLLTAGDMAYFADNYVPDAGQRLDPRCSPLHAIAANLPPVALLTCSHDVLRDEGRAYAAACRTAGVPVRHVEAPGHIHGLVTLRKAIPSGEEHIEKIIRQMCELLSPRK